MLTHVSVVGLLGLAGGCGFVVTSMVTSHWIILADNTRIGLFSHCSSTQCTSINLTTETTSAGKHVQSQFKAVRGLVITGLIVGICGTIMALGFVVDALRSKGVQSLALLRSSLVLNPLGGTITVLGAAVFAATLYTEMSPTDGASLGFSFGLCICGGASMLVAGILVFVGGPRTVTRTTYRGRFSPPRVVMSCMQPPPSYAPPSEEFLIAQFHPPPAYEDKTQPPSYEDALLLPPPYDESAEVTPP
ncbi:hypothetical protein BsWGS_25070 [Bradybaena similaris]